MMNRWLKFLGTLAFAGLVAACGGDGDDDDPSTLAEVAQQQGFTALLAAANKAGLSDELASSSVDFTVFAPTDAAFTSLATQLGFSSATVLVETLPASALESILLYHVLPARKTAADLVAGGATQPTAYTFEAAPSTLALNTTTGVAITDAALTRATVVTADVQASNGIVHVIDKVLVPPGVLNIVQMAQVNPIFSVLVEAVVAAGLVDTLDGPTPRLTVFAPTNDAFNVALEELPLTKAELLASPALGDILGYHVLVGEVRAADVVALPKPATVTTFQGDSFSVGSDLVITDGRARRATLLATNVFASNGVIHVIDKVILPPLNN
jgi:transforming growth factor-beta-induced protein